jgi:hypothetical protein
VAAQNNEKWNLERTRLRNKNARRNERRRAERVKILGSPDKPTTKENQQRLARARMHLVKVG